MVERYARFHAVLLYIVEVILQGAGSTMLRTRKLDARIRTWVVVDYFGTSKKMFVR